MLMSVKNRVIQRDTIVIKIPGVSTPPVVTFVNVYLVIEE